MRGCTPLSSAPAALPTPGLPPPAITAFICINDMSGACPAKSSAAAPSSPGLPPPPPPLVASLRGSCPLCRARPVVAAGVGTVRAVSMGTFQLAPAGDTLVVDTNGWPGSRAHPSSRASWRQEQVLHQPSAHLQTFRYTILSFSYACYPSHATRRMHDCIDQLHATARCRH